MGRRYEDPEPLVEYIKNCYIAPVAGRWKDRERELGVHPESLERTDITNEEEVTVSLFDRDTNPEPLIYEQPFKVVPAVGDAVVKEASKRGVILPDEERFHSMSPDTRVIINANVERGKYALRKVFFNHLDLSS